MDQLAFVFSVSTNRISHMLHFNYVFCVCLVLLSSTVLCDDAVKNHRAEKRQDDSFLFFGGWRPVRSANSYLHTSATGRYHDIISALPGSMDTSSRYYTHALPSNFYKDIYSYYPRPAIKSAPKKNTPVYTESYKPQMQPQKQNGRGAQNYGPQIIDIQNIDLKQLRGLQDAILQAKQLPLSQLNLPLGGTKPYEIVEVSLQALQQNSRNFGLRNNNGYNRVRNVQRKNRRGYGASPKSRAPAQSPVQYEYIAVPKHKAAAPQILTKEISVSPINLQHAIPAVDDVIAVKNIQIVEVPVPSAIPYGISKNSGSRSSSYGKRGNRPSEGQYRIPSQKQQQEFNFPKNSYFAHQTQQPRKHFAPPEQPKPNYNQQQQPEIEAELVKLSEEEIKHLLSNLQSIGKGSQDLLKYLPLGDGQKTKNEEVHLLVTLPQGEHQQGNSDTRNAYETQRHVSSQQGSSFQSEAEKYIRGLQQAQYAPQSSHSSRENSGGYQVQNQVVEHSVTAYQFQGHGERSTVDHYQPSTYQNLDAQSQHDQRGYPDEIPQPEQNSYETENQHQSYTQIGYGASANQQGSNSHDEQPYIQVISPQADENGYKREPVLAVEIKHGQSIEDAIKSLDPETLQRLGAHGKNGLEIEVVEVPIDEYASESKKTETVVSSKNSTVTADTKSTKKES